MPTSGDFVSTSGRAPNASRSASTTASFTLSAAKPECVSVGVSRTLAVHGQRAPVGQPVAPGDGARARVQRRPVGRVECRRAPSARARRRARAGRRAIPMVERPFEPDAALVALGAGDAHRRDLAAQRALGAAGAGDEEAEFVGHRSAYSTPTHPLHRGGPLTPLRGAREPGSTRAGRVGRDAGGGVEAGLGPAAALDQVLVPAVDLARPGRQLPLGGREILLGAGAVDVLGASRAWSTSTSTRSRPPVHRRPAAAARPAGTPARPRPRRCGPWPCTRARRASAPTSAARGPGSTPNSPSSPGAVTSSTSVSTSAPRGVVTDSLIAAYDASLAICSARGAHVVEAALHVERLLGDVVALAVDDLLEAAHGVLDLDVLARRAGERLGDEERLRQELLDLARARRPSACRPPTARPCRGWR